MHAINVDTTCVDYIVCTAGMNVMNFDMTCFHLMQLIFASSAKQITWKLYATTHILTVLCIRNRDAREARCFIYLTDQSASQFTSSSYLNTRGIRVTKEYLLCELQNLRQLFRSRRSWNESDKDIIYILCVLHTLKLLIRCHVAKNTSWLNQACRRYIFFIRQR